MRFVESVELEILKRIVPNYFSVRRMVHELSVRIESDQSGVSEKKVGEKRHFFIITSDWSFSGLFDISWTVRRRTKWQRTFLFSFAFPNDYGF